MYWFWTTRVRDEKSVPFIFLMKIILDGVGFLITF